MLRRFVNFSRSQSHRFITRQHANNNPNTIMKMVFLGTSSSKCTDTRNVSSIALRTDFGIWLFDCGEGTQNQLARCSSLNLSKINKVFVTHMHGDHVFGLPGLYCSLAQFVADSNETDAKFDFYGPSPLVDYLSTALRQSSTRITIPLTISVLNEGKASESQLIKHRFTKALSYKLIDHDNDGIYTLFDDSYFMVQAVRIKHTVPCYGYIITEKDKPGHVDVEKCTQLGLPPGPSYRLLKDGKDVVLDDGRVIRAADVLGPPIKGRKIVILGDTSDARSIIPLAQNADILVHETTLIDEDISLCHKRGHSCPQIAGSLAKEINARALVCTHFSPRYSTEHGVVEVLMRKQAIKAFGSENVIMARDFLELNITRKGNSEEASPIAVDSEWNVANESQATVSDEYMASLKSTSSKSVPAKERRNQSSGAVKSTEQREGFQLSIDDVPSEPITGQITESKRTRDWSKKTTTTKKRAEPNSNFNAITDILKTIVQHKQPPTKFRKRPLPSSKSDNSVAN